MDEVAISNIVSAIISKENVLVGADNDKGVHIFIPTTKELDPNHRSVITLKDLIRHVKKSFEER